MTGGLVFRSPGRIAKTSAYLDVDSMGAASPCQMEHGSLSVVSQSLGTMPKCLRGLGEEVVREGSAPGLAVGPGANLHFWTLSS